MKPKYATTGTSASRPSSSFAERESPGANRSRSTLFGTTAASTPKLAATSSLIAIVIVASRRIARRSRYERDLGPADEVVEGEQVRRQAQQLAHEQQPAPPLVGARPDVRERGDRARVDGRAGVGEELGGGPRRAEDVRLVAVRRQRADQV